MDMAVTWTTEMEALSQSEITLVSLFLIFNYNTIYILCDQAIFMLQSLITIIAVLEMFVLSFIKFP